MVYFTRRFVVHLSMCHFVLMFFSPFSIAITSLGEERANFSAFRTFVRFVLVWICRFPLPLGVWEGLRFVILTLPGLFSYLFLFCSVGYSVCPSFQVLVYFCFVQYFVYLFSLAQELVYPLILCGVLCFLHDPNFYQFYPLYCSHLPSLLHLPNYC